MLKQLSENYLKNIDQYIEENLNLITCGEVYDCYQSFINVSKDLTGIHANYKSLPEYIIHRFIYHLFKNQIIDRQLALTTNQKYRNKYQTGSNEIDIALVNMNKQGNIPGEYQVVRGISIKGAQKVNIDEDAFRANNLIWGTNEGMYFAMITFNDNFNNNPEDYISDNYKIINLPKFKDNLFIQELNEKLKLSELL